MSAEVRTLRTLRATTVPVVSVDDEVVEMLTSMLERAKSGEIQGALIATVESDGAGSVLNCGNAYAGQGARQNVHAALGSVEMLKARFMRDTFE